MFENLQAYCVKKTQWKLGNIFYVRTFYFLFNFSCVTHFKVLIFNEQSKPKKSRDFDFLLANLIPSV